MYTNGDKFRITLLNETGLYFNAVKSRTNIWTVGTQVEPWYIDHLPHDWENTEVNYDRNITYWGVFTTYSKTYQFVVDARAILLSIWFGAGGANAYCRMVIEIYDQDSNSYSLFQDTGIDFATASDDKVKKMLSVATLDPRIQILLKAKSGSYFNIKFWDYDSGTGLWSTDAVFLQHNGIKLLYNASFISGATATNPLIYNASRNTDLQGFDDGNHGAGQGVHTIPAMTPYNIVQNNGSVTWIGNDILQPLLIQNSQSGVVNQVSFTDNNSTPPYNSALIKNLLDSPVSMGVSLSGSFGSNITWDDGDPIGRAMRFVLFELNSNNNSELSNYTYITIYSIALSPGAAPIVSPPPFSVNVNVTLQPQMAYILGIIYDGDGAGFFSGGSLNFNLSDLQVSFKSEYNSGTAAPVAAPAFPASTIIARRPHDLWKKLVKCIDSTETDQYGFPVIIGAYTGASIFLNDDTLPLADNFDMRPNDTLYTCENAIRQIQGQPYISISIADFFTTWFKINGLGLGISGTRKLEIEPLIYFLDPTTEIANFGSNISGFHIEQMTELMRNHISAGYSDPITNNNFGVDEFNIPQKYDAPLNMTPGDIDLSVSAAKTGMYEAEKGRAQKNQSTVSNPSASNTNYLFQVGSAASATDVEDPSGVIHSVAPLNILQYPTAQSTDPTAATAPYIKGLYYPDTAINTGLTPASNTYRNGPLLRSLCDQLDDKVLSYRKQYQQNYNDPLSPLVLPGISKNIASGLISEVADIPVSSLGTKLFRPYFIKFSATYSKGLYALINANPYGYISVLYIDENNALTQYKGFIWSAKQKVGNNAATDFVLLAHPDTTDAALGIS